MVWSPPGGETPPQCLEYEVQLAEDQGEAKAAWAVGTTHTVLQGGQGVGEPCPMAGSGGAWRKTGVRSELWTVC